MFEINVLLLDDDETFISCSDAHRLDNVSPAICTVPIKSLMTSISWRPQPKKIKKKYLFLYSACIQSVYISHPWQTC